MTDELEQMSLNQRRAADKALATLETFAAIWAAEIRLGAMSARIAAVPNEAERAKRIEAMIEQGFIEGAYRHYLDHKDKCDELEGVRATAEQSEIPPEPFGYVYRIISEMRPHDPMYRFAKAGELNPDPEVVRSWTKHAVYTEPQLPQNRDRVIEECASVCDKAEVAYNVAVRKETASFLALMIRVLKSQQDAAIESKQAGQSVPVLPTHGSFHTGVLVKLLLDDAFEILRPNSPEDCPEEPWMRVELGKKYWGILTATPRSVESQRSGDGS